MSATAVVPATRFQNDLAAGWRHFVNGVRLTARDPLALGVLALAGAVTVVLWGGPVGLWLGIDPFSARQYPWRGWVAAFTGPGSEAFRSALLLGQAPILFSQLLGAALVAGALGRSSAPRRWPAAPAPGMPALPLGPRTRVMADVLVVTCYVLVARAAVLSVGGIPLAQGLFGPTPSQATYPEVARLGTLLPSLASPTVAYASSFVVNTILGTLLSFPLVLAWATTGRLDARGLMKLATATLVVFGAATVGAMAHLMPAFLVCVSVSAFLLLRLDDGSRAESVLDSRPLLLRGSPGALHQLRRDAWLSPVRRLRWPLVLAGGLPLVLTFVAWTPGVDAPPAYRLRSLAALGASVQWPILTALALFPFGLALVAPGTSARSLFSGTFLRSWSTFPVARERVIRAVYAHGILAAGFAWLMLWLQLRFFGASLGPVLYELPVVFLLAGICVCEAVGDRRRGLLAVGALAVLQFGLPLGFALMPDVLGRRAPGFGLPLGVAGYVVGLAGSLPPLVHLRGPAAAPSLQR